MNRAIHQGTVALLVFIIALCVLIHCEQTPRGIAFLAQESSVSDTFYDNLPNNLLDIPMYNDLPFASTIVIDIALYAGGVYSVERVGRGFEVYHTSIHDLSSRKGILHYETNDELADASFKFTKRNGFLFLTMGYTEDDSIRTNSLTWIFDDTGSVRSVPGIYVTYSAIGNGEIAYCLHGNHLMLESMLAPFSSRIVTLFPGVVYASSGMSILGDEIFFIGRKSGTFSPLALYSAHKDTGNLNEIALAYEVQGNGRSIVYKQDTQLTILHEDKLTEMVADRATNYMFCDGFVFFEYYRELGRNFYQQESAFAYNVDSKSKYPLSFNGVYVQLDRYEPILEYSAGIFFQSKDDDKSGVTALCLSFPELIAIDTFIVPKLNDGIHVDMMEWNGSIVVAYRGDAAYFLRKIR